MHARYRFAGRLWTPDDEGYQAALALAYSRRERPSCLCKGDDAGLEMYITKIDGRCLVKRMPNTAGDHDPMCASYEPPPELSGLGQVMGNAISDDGEDGGTTLRVAFSLSRKPGGTPPAASGTPSDTVKAETNKLTLRSTLHYLWEQAGFNRWSPRMEGRRTWSVIRKYLVQSCEHKTLKGQSFAEVLYVPEPWSKDGADESKKRRDARLARIVPVKGGARTLMICIGECKSIQQTTFGYKMVVKNAPDFSLFMSAAVETKIRKRFAMEFALKDRIDDLHLMFIATFSLNSARTPELDEIAFMVCSKEWIPFETPDEMDLIDELVKQHRHFIKGLRYNVAATTPLASAVLLDTGETSTALYVVPQGAPEGFADALTELQASSALPSWTWDTSESVTVPALPPVQRAQRPAATAAPIRQNTRRIEPTIGHPVQSSTAAPSSSIETQTESAAPEPETSTQGSLLIDADESASAAAVTPSLSESNESPAEASTAAEAQELPEGLPVSAAEAQALGAPATDVAGTEDAPSAPDMVVSPEPIPEPNPQPASETVS